MNKNKKNIMITLHSVTSFEVEIHLTPTLSLTLTTLAYYGPESF
jgi:hypothetical protein